MIKKQIRLEATTEVQEFVKAAEKCDFDVDLRYERAVVNAKSFLGVLSLGLCRILTVAYTGSNGEFEKVLDKYACITQ